jgi:hypothetical protein
VLDSQWAPSKFSKAFNWSQVYVTGVLTWPNAAFTFLAFPALSYKFGEFNAPFAAMAFGAHVVKTAKLHLPAAR